MQAAPQQDEIQSLVSLFKDGQMAELEPLARKFSDRYPAHGLGWMLLGAIYKAEKRPLDALDAQLKAIEVMPPKAELYSNLGNLQFSLERFADAEASYRTCLALDPNHPNGHYNYGLLLLQASRPREAEDHLRAALRLSPASASIAYQTAVSLLDQKQYTQALPLLQRALALQPDYPEAHDSLSFALLQLGRLDDALRAAQAAVALSPENPLLLGNLLFTLNFSTAATADVVGKARAYGELVSTKAGAGRFSSWCRKAASGKLRIGFVSGDFKGHPVSFFLMGLLEAIDRSHFELFAYSTVRFEDDYTQKIKSAVDSFQLLSLADDAQAAQQIHDDGIDILIDLAGHTGHGRLPVFAFRPAPVQVSWLGYFASTGVAEMDYVLVDPVAVPAAEVDQFTESAWNLPETRLCFTPPDDAPEPGPPPALKNRSPTFGCYQGLPKVNDQVLECWQPIFKALPKARLRWQCMQFTDPQARLLAGARLRRHGIKDHRVELLPNESRLDYLRSLAQVDLILDTFPFPGGTTTCEALWMGVPTLTLAGHNLLSRQGESMMAAAGLGDWIARDRAQYQAKAIAAIDDLPALAQLRSQLRPLVQTSPLFDNRRFARNFEQAMQDIWRAARVDCPAPCHLPSSSSTTTSTCS
jgi:protein O-GlcNAc transferase